MSDLRTVLQDAAARPTADLDLATTLDRGLRRRRQRRAFGATAAGLVMAVIAGITVVATRAPEPRPPVTTGLEDIPVGWSDLPAPPDGLAAGALAWTGRELLMWSGDDVSQPGDGGAPSESGYAFDPSTSTWRSLPKAPIPGREFAASAWTGRELVVWGGERPGSQALTDGAAYNPATNSWRRLPGPPVDLREQFSSWTGDELLIWGDSAARPGTGRAGIAYDPVRDRWREIAAAPFIAQTAWNGTEVVAVSRTLHQPTPCDVTRNDCPGAASAAYDVSKDSWRELGPTGLYSPATAVLAIGDDVVAWDYSHATRTLYAADHWQVGPTAPLRFMECYPRAVATSSYGLGLYCGQTVRYDGGPGTWSDVSDYNTPANASGVAADDVVLVVGTDPKGAGRLRAYRPRPTTSHDCDGVQFEPAGSNRRADDIIAVDVDCTTAQEVARQSELAVGGSYSAEGFQCPKAAEDVRPSRYAYQCTSGEAIVRFTSLPYPTPDADRPVDARIVAPRPVRLAVTDDFGLVTAVRDTADGWEVDVDRVGWLTAGPEADAAALAHHETVDTEYYLVNDDRTTRTYRIAPDCVVWGNISFGHVGDPQRVDLDVWREFLGSTRADTTLFHFEVDDRVITAVEEQYRP